MIENFWVSIGAVFPIFVLIAIGLFVKQQKLMNPTELKHLNKMIFRVFFFCMLFTNIYRADFADVWNPRLMLFSVVGVTTLFILSLIFAILFEKRNDRRGVITQAIFRSNFVILGIPIVVNIFGEQAAVLPSVVIAAVVPLYNIYSVAELEAFRGGSFDLLKILKGVLKNPMIQGILCGLVFNLAGIPVPDPIMKPVAQVGACTTPLALIVLGATFDRGQIADSVRDLRACLIGRLFVAPLLFLSAAAALGFRGAEFVTILAIAATPCAVASFTMAQQMGGDANLAGNTVIFSSALSCLTMFGWIFVTKMLGMF